MRDLEQSLERSWYFKQLTGDDKYGYELINMMEYYGVNNLSSLSNEEIKEYYLHVRK